MAFTLQTYIQRVLEDEQRETSPSKQERVEAQEDAAFEAISDAIDQHPVGRPMATKVHR